MSMTKLSKEIRFHNGKKGFESPAVDIDKKLLLAVSEICEAQEELRDGRLPNEIYYEYPNKEINQAIKDGKMITTDSPDKPCGFPIEIADAIIRLLDICGAFDIDIDNVITQKLEYNLSRPLKHGRKF